MEWLQKKNVKYLRHDIQNEMLKIMNGTHNSQKNCKQSSIDSVYHGDDG